MEAPTALVAILLADSTVTAIVDHRIRPHTATFVDDMPFILYRVSDYEPIITHNQAANNTESTEAFTTIDVSAYAVTYKAAHQLHRIIKKALQNKQGTYATNIVIKGISVVGESELSEFSADGNEAPIYSVSQEYKVMHNEL